MKYRDFLNRYPELAAAWESLHQAEAAGPLDLRAQRLVKLGVALGAFREGAVRSAVRKALQAGVTRAEVEQAVALGASNLGLQTSVALHGWIQAALEEAGA